jgi:hypothetical protein
MSSSRTVILGAIVAVAVAAGAVAFLTRPKATAPVTVYLTPT